MTEAAEHARLNPTHSPVMKEGAALTVPSVVPNSFLAVHCGAKCRRDIRRLQGLENPLAGHVPLQL
jgi:hypothetical protein